MTRALAVRVERWPLARPFRIARGSKTEAEVVVAEIADGGLIGRGEAVPYARYGETAQETARVLRGTAAAVAAGLDRAGLAGLLPAGAARNALDCALWDLEAKATGRRAWTFAGLPEIVPVVTAETIAVGDPEAMACAAAELRDRPLLKIKIARDRVVERVAAVRQAASKARLIVDANEAWELATLSAVWEPLASLGVELIEQPLPAGSDAELAGLRGPVPLCADESCHTAADLDRMAERYQTINIKLDKTGGLSEALRLTAAAAARGLNIMVGCMVCTSLGIAPATLLTPFASVVDLDGPLWLAADRAPSLRYSDGLLYPPAVTLWG